MRWLLAIYVLLVTFYGFDAARIRTDRPPVPHYDYPQEFPHGNVPEIIEACYSYLQLHLCEGVKWDLPFHFYRPSLQKYSPDQWLWDSSCHMMSWSHRNVTNSILDMRTMLQMQQPDGRVPEIINWGPHSEKDDILTLLQYSNTKFSDLTQMPLLPYALRAIHNASADVAILKEFVPKLVHYYQWWANTRIIDDDDLVVIIHGWESGLDASPLYDPAFNIHVAQPTYTELYPKFVELVLEYKWKYDWNQTDIVYRKRAPIEILDGYFLVKDVGVNSVYAAGWGILADLAALFDSQLSQQCRAQQHRFESAILRKCWDTTLQRFISWYKADDGSDKPITIEAVQSMFPLLLTSLSAQQSASIVHTQLTNTSKFWLPYPVPSCSADAAQFTPTFTVDLMWRGPTWPILNWFMMEGLTRHGYYEQAGELLDRWTALYVKTGVWEQYNAFNGTNYGVEGLGMSTLIVDWLYRLGRV